MANRTGQSWTKFKMFHVTAYICSESSIAGGRRVCRGVSMWVWHVAVYNNSSRWLFSLRTSEGHIPCCFSVRHCPVWPSSIWPTQRLLTLIRIPEWWECGAGDNLMHGSQVDLNFNSSLLLFHVLPLTRVWPEKTPVTYISLSRPGAFLPKGYKACFYSDVSRAQMTFCLWGWVA